MIQTDEDLAAEAGLGDRASFAEIVHRHGPVLYRYAWGMLHNHADAEDAVQEGLIRAWRGIAASAATPPCARGCSESSPGPPSTPADAVVRYRSTTRC